MDCTLCFHHEHQHFPSGKTGQYKPPEKAKAMICGKCAQKLLFLKMGNIPWDGKLEKEPENQPTSLKRRKGARR